MVLSLIAVLVPATVGPTAPPGPVMEDVGDVELTEMVEQPSLDLPLDVTPNAPESPADAAAAPSGGRAELAARTLISYVVQHGDTVNKLAGRFGVNVDTLVWANDLADPNLIAVGTQLLIPPSNGVLHRVRPGDTLADLARHYSSDLQKAIESNKLEPPYVIVVGQRVHLPDGTVPQPAVTPEGQSGAAEQKPDVAEAVELASNLGVGPARPEPLPHPTGATPDQARFILSVAEPARASQRETGVPASVSIAQAILESFWGGSRLSRENKNYFGIKAKERHGPAGVVWYDVWEVVGGRNVTQREPFRAYNTLEESFVDHGHFFLQNRRYAAALAARDDPREFARRINSAGYATDPSYAPKLIGLMDRFSLYQYDLQ